MLGATRGAHCATALLSWLNPGVHSARVRSSCAAAAAATRVRSASATVAALICARAAAAFTRDCRSPVRRQPRACAHRRTRVGSSSTGTEAAAAVRRACHRVWTARIVSTTSGAPARVPPSLPLLRLPCMRCYRAFYHEVNCRRRVPPSIGVIGSLRAVDNASIRGIHPCQWFWHLAVVHCADGPRSAATPAAARALSNPYTTTPHIPSPQPPARTCPHSAARPHPSLPHPHLPHPH